MRIVIKVGTSTLAYPTGLLNIRRVEELCRVLSDLKNAGNEVVLISSGAIGMGVGKLSLGKRPTDIPTKQAAAAVGQCELMYTYDKLFGEYNLFLDFNLVVLHGSVVSAWISKCWFISLNNFYPFEFCLRGRGLKDLRDDPVLPHSLPLYRQVVAHPGSCRSLCLECILE